MRGGIIYRWSCIRYSTGYSRWISIRYIGYESGILQSIPKCILKGIIWVKYKVLHPGNIDRFRVHGHYLQSRCVLYMGGVEIGSCFHIYTCRDTLLYEITYLCSPVACYFQSSYCCMQKPIHTQNIHASLRSFAAREEVVRECMSCGKTQGCI